MDMDAGVEHLGRGTAKAVDALIIVVEPGRRSLQTAEAIRRLAKDLGINKCYAVGFKTKSEKERQFIRDNLPELGMLGFVNYHPEIAEADLEGAGVFIASPEAVAEAKEIKSELEEHLTKK